LLGKPWDFPLHLRVKLRFVFFLGGKASLIDEKLRDSCKEGDSKSQKNGLRKSRGNSLFN
jgi:hypothetical protein